VNAILLCRTRHVPTPEQVAEALCKAGYQAFVEVRNGPPTSLSAEVRYAPGRMPIVVDIYNDLYDDPDEKDYDYFNWMEELVPNPEAREDIRRFIFVSAMENVEAKALKTVTDYLRDQTNSTVIMQDQLDKQ